MLLKRNIKTSVFGVLSLVMMAGVLAIGMPLSGIAHADTGLTIGGGADVAGVVDSDIAISDLHISGTGNPTVPVDLYVPSGSLSMTTVTGLTFTTTDTGSHLNFSGSLSDVNTALATLHYRTDRPKNIQLSVSLTDAGTVYNPTNGHLYEVVQGPDDGEGGHAINFVDAAAAAQARTLDGMNGYLVTITSAAENQFIKDRIGSDSWIGASDSAVEGVWKWMNGPESGTQFWQGDETTGTVVNSQYNNWANSEPNGNTNESCGEFYAGNAQWNDLPCEGAYLQSYVVEYGSDSQHPSVVSKDVNVSVTYPTGATVPVTACPQLAAIAADPVGYRYDTITLTQDIDCGGATIDELFHAQDENDDWIDFRGTFNGNGHTISNFEVNADGAGSSYHGLFGKAFDATIENVTLEGIDVHASGQQCVGGLVGNAEDTTITNVHLVDAAVRGSSSIGGIVGCTQARNGEHDLTASSYSGGVTAANGFIGGIAGYSEVYDGALYTVSDNTFGGSVTSTNSNSVGGIVGEADLDGTNSRMNISSNTVGGNINSSSGYYAGGVLGYADADDKSALTMNTNTVTATVHGNNTVGGIAGEIDTYDGTTFTANGNSVTSPGITTDGITTGGLIGGFSGDVSGAVTINSNTVATAVTAQQGYGGGLIGWYYNYSAPTETISHNRMSGSVDGGSGDGYVSGMIGQIYDNGLRGSTVTQMTLADNASSMDVTGSGNFIGGLVGDLEVYYGITVTSDQNHVSGTITGTGERVGGLFGYIAGLSEYADTTVRIVDSYVNATIAGSQSVGGIVGETDTRSDDGEYTGALDIERVYSYGSVTGNDYVGGVAGYINNIDDQPATVTLKNTFSAAAVADRGDSQYIGALLGRFNQGTYHMTTAGNYYDRTRTGQPSCISGDIDFVCTQVNDANDQPNYFKVNNARAPLSTWNFATVWGFKNTLNDGFPCLLTESGCVAASNDGDGDGIADSTESSSPNGDANGDGIADNTQANVTSFVNDITGKSVAVAVNSACTLTNVSTKSETVLSSADVTHSYPLGLLDFTADCGTPGYTTAVTQYYYDPPTGNFTVRKFVNGTYQDVAGAIVARQTINGHTVLVVSYNVTDGGALDADGTANGVIVDPAGSAVLVASTTVGAPNTGIGFVVSRVMPTIAVSLLVSYIVAAVVAGAYVLRRRAKTSKG